MGEDAGSDERLSLLYGYDSFGNVGGLGEEYVDGPNGTHSFDYDDQNRVTNGFGHVYGWRSNGTFSIFAGKTFTYDAYQVRYGVNRVNGHDRYDYDLAGNMTLRRKGTAARRHSPGTGKIGWRRLSKAVRSLLAMPMRRTAAVSR